MSDDKKLTPKQKAAKIIESIKEQLSKDDEGNPIAGPYFSNRSHHRGKFKGESEPVPAVGHAKRKRTRKAQRAARTKNR